MLHGFFFWHSETVLEDALKLWTGNVIVASKHFDELMYSTSQYLSRCMERNQNFKINESKANREHVLASEQVGMQIRR